MVFPEASLTLGNTMNTIAKKYERELNEIMTLMKASVEYCDTLVEYTFRSEDSRRNVLKYLDYHGYRTYNKDGETYGISWAVPKK